VLDSLRAALAVPGAGLSPTAPTAIEGYSQGGGAAGWAAQLHASYAPDLSLTGVSLGGTPARLQTVASSVNGSAFFALLGGAAIGFGAAYPSLDLDSYLNATGRKAFAQLQTMCLEQGLASFAFGKIQNYTKTGTNPIGDPPFAQVLQANSLGAIRPDVPVLQTHGLLDEIIPQSVEVTLHDQWCELGATSQLDTFVGEHVTTEVEDQPAVISWIGARLAGQPAPGNC
jgi:pimeloyl-ACP methyl ester carboxylesterase